MSRARACAPTFFPARACGPFYFTLFIVSVLCVAASAFVSTDVVFILSVSSISSPFALLSILYLLGRIPKVSRFFFSELAGHSDQFEFSEGKKRAGTAVVVGSLI